MKFSGRTKMLGAIAVFLALSWLGISFVRRHAREVQATRVVLLEVRMKQKTEEASIRRRREEIAAAERQQAVLRAELAEFIVPPAPVLKSAKPAILATSEAELSEWMKKEREEQKKPERQLAELAWFRSQFAGTSGLLFRELKFPPEKISRFQDNAIRRYEQQMDLRAVTQAHGVDLMDPAIGKFFQMNEDEYQAAQRVLLGDDDYRRFQEYERRASVRGAIGTLAGAATTAGIPFTKEKTEELIEVMANTDPAFVAGGKAELVSMNWDLVDARAKAILSAEQFDFFRTVDPSPGNGRTWSKLNRAMNEALRSEQNAR